MDGEMDDGQDRWVAVGGSSSARFSQRATCVGDIAVESAVPVRFSFFNASECITWPDADCATSLDFFSRGEN